eukprot:Sdes_comp18024_c0_seq1m7336
MGAAKAHLSVSQVYGRLQAVVFFWHPPGIYVCHDVDIDFLIVRWSLSCDEYARLKCTMLFSASFQFHHKPIPNLNMDSYCTLPQDSRHAIVIGYKGLQLDIHRGSH